MEEQVESNFRIQTQEMVCQSGNKAKLFCISPTCQKEGIVCGKQDCKCEREHTNCEYIRVQSLLRRIQFKKKDITSEVSKVIRAMQKIYDDAIEKLSQEKQSLQDQQEFFGLSKIESMFVKLIKSNCGSEIKGETTSKVITHLHLQTQFTVNQEDISDFWQIYKVEFETLFNNFQKITSRPRNKLQSVITNDEKTLKSFFNVPVLGFKLLYRASQNEHSVPKFRKACSGKANTIVIALTEFDRIIGGFAHGQWNEYLTAYVQDTEKKNFLFSLTKKEKYPIVSTQHGIYNNPNFGPTFGGGHDFYIANNSHTAQNTSYCKIGHSYNLNGKFNTNQQRSYTEFSGATVNQYVRFPEWEVFEVDFL